LLANNSFGKTESNPAADAAAVAERINFLRLYSDDFIFGF
jgi:hypothetical protein